MDKQMLPVLIFWFKPSIDCQRKFSCSGNCLNSIINLVFKYRVAFLIFNTNIYCQVCTNVLSF